MSHPDPSYDPDNSYEDDEMFYGEDSASYHPDADHEIESQFDDVEDAWYDDIDDSMDGDHESGFASAGWGVDESYRDDIDAYENYYGEDY